MKLRTIAAVIVALLAAVVAALGPGVGPVDAQGADGDLRLVSVAGQSTARPDLSVDVVLAVPAGRSVEQAAAEALRAQGARPVQPATLGSDGFATTGVVWPAATTTQWYNPADEPIDSHSLLQAVQATWSNVTESRFSATTAGATTRCASLVKECPGPQVTDGFNDVGWQRLKGSRNTLGVAWSVDSAPEVDIALNLSAGPWDAALTQAVLLHEEGHFAGLGHSADAGSVMYAYISNPLRMALTPDDVEGITYLYPAQTVTVEGTVSDGALGIGGATVQLSGTPYTATTTGDGRYSLAGVPAPVTYDIRASADGAVDSTRAQVSAANTRFDFTLAPSQETDSGGPSHCANPANANHPSCRNR